MENKLIPNKAKKDRLKQNSYIEKLCVGKPQARCEGYHSNETLSIKGV
ncbi:hypothetical protein [Candidatus Tisiphia endosymbiont of Temnostethus pusillus]